MTTDQTQRIAVLGGGPAGYEAALVAAELGAEVTIIADEGLGGNSVLWDCVPSKALIVAAEAMGWIDRSHDMGVRHAGWHDDEPVTVDFPAVAERVLALGANQSADIERKVCREAGVRLLRGRGRISGYHEVTADLVDDRLDDRVDGGVDGGADAGHETFEADFVLVATGSTARVLPFFEPDGQRVLTGQDVYGLDELPEHLVVVGSGATGAEFAHAFVRFGTTVTLVSSRDLILPTEDPDAAEVIEDVFERRGMTILRNARASSCTNHGDHVEVGLVEGPPIEASHVLFTVGQVPASDGLGLELAGVEANRWGGIDVDKVGRTSCRWTYAAGDVVGRVMLASVAAMQGRIAMWHALGQAVTPLRWDAVASTIFTDPEVATVGLSREEAERRGIPVVTARLDFRSNPRAKMADHTDGFVKVHAMVGSGMVLGGVVVSSSASDLVQPLAVAVQNRLSVSQLAHTVSVYPSMQGSVTEAARMLMGKVERDPMETG